MLTHTTAAKRLAALALTTSACAATLTAVTEPASAVTLYSNEGGYAWASAHCDRENRTMQVRFGVTRDRYYETQNVQYRYRLTDAVAGVTSVPGRVGNVSVSRLTPQNSANGPVVSMRRTHWLVEYQVRFGRLYGYTRWSAWTRVENHQTWRARGWVNAVTTHCST